MIRPLPGSRCFGGGPGRTALRFGSLALVQAAVAWGGHATCRADEPTRAEEAAFRTAVGRVAAAVVRVEPAGDTAATLGGGEAAPGSPSSGLVVDREGWILTTSFAVPGDATMAVVILPEGGRMAARVSGRDVPRGLVLLRTDPLPDAAALEPVDRGGLAPGQWAIAVGRGWTHAAPSVAVGVVSAIDRSWGRAVQTDAAVSPANYGGPLIDIRGRVIGILAPLPADTAGLMAGTELYDAGIGFAVPFTDVLRVLPRLQGGETLAGGILGVNYRSRDQINGAPILAGCRFGSPAARAGLRGGDRIVAVDGRPVTRIADARHVIAPKYAGDTVEILVERAAAGEAAATRLTMSATLVGALPPFRRAVIGAVVAPPADAAGGLRIEWVLPAGPADRAGLRAGQLLRAAATGAGEPVPLDAVATLTGLLAEIEPGGRVVLMVAEDGPDAEPRRIEVTTDPAPGELPSAWPALAAPAAETTVMRLEAADVAKPALAVLPTNAADRRLGVLVHLGSPRGLVEDGDATVWRDAAARHGVAVVLPASEDPRRWSTADIAGIAQALATLEARQPIDPTRIGVSGLGAGGFAWIVGERLGDVFKGVAVSGAPLPRQATIPLTQTGRAPWVLLDPPQAHEAVPDLARRLAADRRRLEEAGYRVGAAPRGDAASVAGALCGWVWALGLL